MVVEGREKKETILFTELSRKWCTKESDACGSEVGGQG
jgi:hypothetical protein